MESVTTHFEIVESHFFIYFNCFFVVYKNLTVKKKGNVLKPIFAESARCQSNGNVQGKPAMISSFG